MLAPFEIKRQTKYLSTALMLAAQTGNLECCKILAPEEKTMKDDKQRTALVFAVENKRDECAKFLADLEAGQFVEEKDVSALIKAIQVGCKWDVVECLFEKEWNMKTKGDMNCLMFACTWK